jgi:N-acetylmuramoyl-L-alanine amidase
MRRDVSLIVIHCSASPNGKTLWEGDARKGTLRTPGQVIDRWHQARGFRRSDEWRQLVNPRLEAIGYHWVVDLDGAIESGRHLDEVGAHCVGHNRKSVGICMVGTDRFSLYQWDALKTIVQSMRLKYPGATVCGHRDLSPDADGDGLVEPWEWLKTCPGFDVAAWLLRGFEPQLENILQDSVKGAS